MQKSQVLNRLSHIRNSLLMGFAADVLFHGPEASDALRRVVLQIGDITFPLTQIADALQREEAREQVCLEFRKLVARSATAEPFEVVEKYAAITKQMDRLHAESWYAFAKLIRNTIRHGSVVFTPFFESRLPITYREITITVADSGRSLDGLLNYANAVRLVDDMTTSVRDHMV